MCVTLEVTYFHAELVQLIVSQSDSELEVQRYGMKKNMLTVDPIMRQDELLMRQREKPSPNRHSWFLKTEPRKPSFRFLNFEVSSVWFGFLKPTDIRNFHRIPHTPIPAIKYLTGTTTMLTQMTTTSQTEDNNNLITTSI